MTWVKTDDGAPEHMKLRGAGTAAFALWNAGLAFCNRNLTDGRIEEFLVPDVWRPIGEKFNHRAAAENLVLAVLWHRAGETCVSKLCPANAEVAARLEPIGGFVVHDYFEYQKSKAEILEDRKKGADRVRRHREKALEDAAFAAIDLGVTNSVGNAVTPGVTPLVTNAVTHNDDSRRGAASLRPGLHPDRENRLMNDDSGNNRLQQKSGTTSVKSTHYANSNAVTNTVSNGTPVPAPVPDPLIERDRVDKPLAQNELEAIGFKRLGALAGGGGAAMAQLGEVYRHELDDALKTDAKSWKYVAKVIASAREQAAKPKPLPYQGRGYEAAGQGRKDAREVLREKGML